MEKQRQEVKLLFIAIFIIHLLQCNVCLFLSACCLLFLKCSISNLLTITTTTTAQLVVVVSLKLNVYGMFGRLVNA